MTAQKDINKNNGFSAVSDDDSADRLFFSLFYLCLGFFTTAIGVFGRSAFKIPFLVVCFFICLRLVMRSDCRARMYKLIHSVELRLVAALSLCLIIYALSAMSGDSEQIRLFRKPATLLLGAVLLGFILSHKDLLDKQKALHGLLLGCVGVLIGVIFVSVWQWSVMSNAVDGSPSYVLPIRIYALNDELKILSILIFFIAAGLATKLNRIILSACLAITVFVVSFYTLGPAGDGSGASSVVHAQSEAVQFGLPIAVGVLLLSALVPKFVTHAVFSGAAAVMVTAPWLFQFWYYLAESFDLPRAKKVLVRAEIWDAASRSALTRPFFGHGLDAARAPDVLKFEQKYYTATEVLHPHNMFVQIWLDMGLIGVTFVLAIGFFAWRGVCKIPIGLRPPVLAGIVMYLIFALTTHSVWQSWSMILLFTVFVLGSFLTQADDLEKSTR